MKLVTAEADSAQVPFPPPLLYLAALLIALTLDWLLPLPARLDGIGLPLAIRLAAGMTIGLAGIAIMAAGAGLFRRVGTNLEPWRTATTLVTSGPFRWTRNPMYLGMALLYAGLAIAFDSWIALLFLPLVLLVMRRQVIDREERYLEIKFGDDYRRYKAGVRRWL